MTYNMKLDSLTQSHITIKLFKNVQNVKELRQKLIEGTLKCCIIKPSLIVDPFVVTLAANKALTSEKLTTKSIFTEILFNLSISKNISQSLLLFGIDDKETDILVVTIDDDNEVFDAIKGEEIDISTLSNLNNPNAIKKAYKLRDEEIETDLIAAVCNKIAIKDFL